MKFQFEFVDHVVGFVCLILMATTTWIARELDPLTYEQRHEQRPL